MSSSAPSSQTSPKIAVIGGGISGLAAAQRLIELNPQASVTLLEASDRLGGVLSTMRRDGFLIERSADMFTTREPWALDLCRRIGFEDQLVPTNNAQRKAFIVRRGRLVEVPAGFTLMTPTRVWPIVTTPLLSLRGKARLAWEMFTARKADDGDESLASFATRRMGREAYQRIVQPLIGGIYTADPEQLSMAATMQQFVQMEQEHGSLYRGMKKGAASQTGSGARYGLFVGPREGMSSFVQAVADQLPENCVRLNTPVRGLKQDETWLVDIGSEVLRFDAVILAASAHRSAQLIRDMDATLAGQLESIPHASAAVVVQSFRKDQIEHPLNGFGFVAPLVENRRILASSFTSVKFDGRAPDGCVLLRTFVGGACQPELNRLDDGELLKLVAEELGDLIGLRGEPIFEDVVRWNDTMPQYHVGHLDLVDKIEARVAALPNLELAGNAYRGVGIPFCIHGGEQAAERTLSATGAPTAECAPPSSHNSPTPESRD